LNQLRIGLIGDRDDSVTAHRAIPLALELAGTSLDVKVSIEWLATESLTQGTSLSVYAGLWCVPASPYLSMNGALTAIRFARENRVPFLGTCGGFQHGILEYARNVLGWEDAGHAETNPDTKMAVIAPLTCSLVEKREPVLVAEGSRLHSAYGKARIEEGYRCSFGLNPAFVEQLTADTLSVTATDGNGDVRGLEMEGHPFFVLTLFQPERAALEKRVPPIVTSFLQAALGKGESR